MPDLAALTDDQRAALRELNDTAEYYRLAIEQRVAAQLHEARCREDVQKVAYRIAGVA